LFYWLNKYRPKEVIQNNITPDLGLQDHQKKYWKG